MMSAFMMTSLEMARHLAKQAQERRLSLNLSQHTLAERAGLSYAVLKKFEQTGKISLESLLKMALALGRLEAFKDLFEPTPQEHFRSLDALIQSKPRQRGRQ